jgi:light-regulated signal transduction histidine kinase (bacteriophytochrome)
VIVEERTAANRELAFQVEEKSKRADELAVIVEERLAANRELEFQVEEKGKRADELVMINVELARSNAELEQFAYVATHDLQEPLRAVASCVQLLQKRYDGHLDERADEFITHAVDGTKRMQTLINDLLAYSRISTHAQVFASTNCDMVLREALANLMVAIAESGAVVTHDPLPTVSGDATQLTQLFQNLVGNALKFRGERPSRIHIGAARENGDWRFSVVDNGIGMEPQYFERVFLVFQRLHTRKQYQGTGIGLAICKKVVERHGGRIWAESQLGEGATFCFTVPETK